MSNDSLVPICKPGLPDAHALHGYLVELDQCRVYTNHGALCRRLRKRLAALLGVGEQCIALTSSGTSALVVAIIAAAGRAGPDRPLCLLPAYSFVATAAAALQCGYQPYFLDVGKGKGALAPDKVFRHPQLARTGLVVPASPYGRQIDFGAWKGFTRVTNVPVVIDAAAGFDLLASEIDLTQPTPPLAISLHATKTLSTGEGGIVVADTPVAERALRASNFGFLNSRASIGASTNAKMSEYHAAVGLAECDDWSQKRQGFIDVAEQYLTCADEVGLRDRFCATTAYATSCVLFYSLDGSEAAQVEEALNKNGVETRRWYGNGIHRQPYFREFGADETPNSDQLTESVLGLPMSVDLPADTIARIVDIIATAIRRQREFMAYSAEAAGDAWRDGVE